MKKISLDFTSFAEQVQHVFEHKIKPTVQLDGGDMELVSADEETGVVVVRLAGACVGCPLSSITLTLGVERELLESVPGFTTLEVADD